MAFKRWSQIDPDRPETMPPLRVNILLYSAISGGRSWYFLQHEAHRVRVMRDYLFTHWREEMTCDYP